MDLLQLTVLSVAFFILAPYYDATIASDVSFWADLIVCMGLTPFHIFLPFLGTAQSRAAGFQTVAHHCCNLYKLPSLQQVIVLRIYFGRIRSSALCTCDNSARHFPLAFPRSVRKRHGHMGYRSGGLPRDMHLMKSK